MPAWHESGNVQDAVAGVLLALVGTVAVTISTSYRGASGGYPGTLGAVLAVLGLFLVLQAVRRSRSGTESRPLATSPLHLMTALAIAAAFLALVPAIGFYSSSLLVLVVLPLALGFRRFTMLAIATVLFMAAVYGTFSILLERPLPREFFQV